MTNFEKLNSLVSKGQLEIYYELSLPRSDSTIWQIAVTEAPELAGQINEPSCHADFKSRRHDEPPSPSTRSFEDYCGRILERLEGNLPKNKIGLFAASAKQKYGLVINDLVHSISTAELKSILSLTDKVVITVRDPRIQGFSALTRVMNDHLDNPGGGNISSEIALKLANKTSFTATEIAELIGPGKNKINPAHILAGLSLPKDTELTAEHLLQVIKKAVDTTSNDYVELCWNNLKAQIAAIEEAFPKTKLIIIDGTDLVNNPEVMMKKSSEELGITYTPDMVNGWHKSNKNNFHCCITEGMGEKAKLNAWNGPARESEGFKQNSSRKPEVDEFPVSMRDKLHAAIGIYDVIAARQDRLRLEQKPGVSLR